MKIRKRHRIVVLFWLPFWTVVMGMCVLAGWSVGLLRFSWP